MNRLFVFKWKRLVAGMSLCMFALCGCGRKPTPNLLLITLDTTRADRLGCYGYSLADTPVLDSLARRGVLFERAFTPAPLTLPAHASMLTGLNPPEHGLRINGQNRLDDSVSTLAELLKERGYVTGAFLASYVLHSRFGLGQGFEVYDDNWIGDGSTGGGLRRQREGGQVVDGALKWLAERESSKPFFSWVHLYEPHAPYVLHRELFGSKYAGRPYDAEIAYTDMQVGRLVDYLKERELLDQTLIVIAGDHGEGLGDHDERDHGYTLYNSTLRVPLIFFGGGVGEAGVRVRANVSLSGIYATVLDMLTGETKAGGFAGACSGMPVPDTPVYAETLNPLLSFNWAPLYAVIDGQWKYVRAPNPELYDLNSDMGDAKNLLDEHPRTAADMEQKLAKIEEGFAAVGAQTVQLSAADRQALSSLGYTAGGGAVAAETENLPDVKDMLPLLNRTFEAQQLLVRGKANEAAEIMGEVVRKDPENLSFRFLLAKALYRGRRLDEAEDILRASEDMINPQVDPDVAVNVLSLRSAVLCAMGNLSGGLQSARRAVDADPFSATAANSLAWLLATQSGADEAEDAILWAEKAVDLGGGVDASHYDTLAAAYAAAGRFERAVETAQRALELARMERRLPLISGIQQRLKLYQNRQPCRAADAMDL